MHELAKRLLVHIRREEFFSAGDRVGIAVSGGIDSGALLRLLLELRGELGIVLSVVHFNHKLRGADSDSDQEFVAGLARAHSLEFHTHSEDVAEWAGEQRFSVEAAARELRYGFFREQFSVLGSQFSVSSPSGAKAPVHNQPENRSAESAAPRKNEIPQAPPSLNKIATGHTLDDQAETVLLRLIRGTGLRGLGAIHPRVLVEDEDEEVCGEIVRPLLEIRRRELEKYLSDLGQDWREDSSNRDSRFTRNRLRRRVMPLLEKEFNPAVAEGLAELAGIARGEEDYWENEAAGWMGTTVQWSEPEWAREGPLENNLVQIGGLEHSASVLPPTSRAKGAREMGHPASDSDLRSQIATSKCLVRNATVSRMWLLGEPLAVQRRVVKAIGEYAGIPLEFKHVEEILRFAGEDGPVGKELALPLGWKFAREPEAVIFVTPDLRKEQRIARNYEYELSVPGQIRILETNTILEALRLEAHAAADAPEYNPQQLLDAASLRGLLRVRNWRAGDRFWPAHTKSPKKIKELLQERHVVRPERHLWPVVLCGDEIIWMRGFAVPAGVRAQAGKDAVLIREVDLATE